MIFKIKGRFPGLNEIIKADRTHYAVGAKLKKTSTDAIAWQLPKTEIDVPIKLKYTFYLPKKDRRDLDNIFSGFNKSFCDALQKRGLIKNDSRKEIVGFEVDFQESDDYLTIVEIKR